MEQLELEGIAEAAYRAVGQDPESPHVLRLVRADLGPNAIRRGPRPISGPAALVRIYDDWYIYLARSLPPRYALFATAHEYSHLLLHRHGYQGDDEERLADCLAAALIAPRAAFLRARRAFGDALPELANAFGTTETGAALRLGEVVRMPLAVVAPATVRVRGPESFAWPNESTLRRWARQPGPGLRKVRLTDDTRRVMLDASSFDIAA